MNPRSLRLRLLGGAALWIILALLIAGFAIGWMFTGNVERSMRDGLSASLNRLVAQIDPLAEEPVPGDALPDPRYAIPLSGMYWQVETAATDDSWRSRSLGDHVLDTGAAVAPGGAERFGTLAGPGAQPLSAMVREVSFSSDAGPRVFRVTLAEDRALLDESIRRFGGDLMLALAVLGLALILAAWLQVQLGLKPLEHLREGAEAAAALSRRSVAAGGRGQ